ncbi:MAG: hypothetical protein P8N58_07475 [Emcibacteraceae bacterium]|nr:hypothetical protein [Emcibacteraceae bacterium]
MRIFITTLITFWSIWINTSAQDTNVITVIKSKILEQIAREAERKKIIDITVKHVVDGEQHVGIGFLHRPVMKSEAAYRQYCIIIKQKFTVLWRAQALW